MEKQKNQNQYEKLKENRYENLGWSILGVAYVASMITALAAGVLNSSCDNKNIEKWIKPSQVSSVQVSNIESIAQSK